MRGVNIVGGRSFSGSEARQLLRRARTGTLATLSRDGGIPYGSLVNVATAVNGEPLILVSTLAWHTQNLIADARASLMVAEPPAAGDALTGPRITIMGRFASDDTPAARARYLARHPQAATYAAFGDFALWRLAPTQVHAVAGFGRIETLSAAEVFPAHPGFEDLAASAIAHMNADHADSVKAMAEGLLGAPAADWRVAAIDPDGCDLTGGPLVARLTFDAPVSDGETLRTAMAGLARRARN
jgi:putative heme iron utilization protein